MGSNNAMTSYCPWQKNDVTPVRAALPLPKKDHSNLPLLLAKDEITNDIIL